MSTSKVAVKVRLPADLVERLKALFPGYGELSAIIQIAIAELVQREEAKREKI